MRLLLSTLLFVGVLANAQVHFGMIQRDVVEQRLKSVVADNTKREQILKAAFDAAGCHSAMEQPVKHEKQPNLICVLQGTSASAIVVGAHLDKVSSGMGAVDDWSGAAMLPSLYEGMVDHPPVHTYIFIAFSGEEDGLVGSRFYVSNLPEEERAKIVAMVNLECLGLGPTKVWVTHSDRNLVNLLAGTANGLQIPVGPMNVDRVGTDDSEPFRQKKVPNITVHSITQDTWPILHSGRDQLGAINFDAYYESYRLAAAYLAVLDSSLPSSPSAAREAPPKTSP